MGLKVSNLNFASLKQVMIDKGVSQEKADACWADLLIILHALEDTGLPHAVTEGADEALHTITNDTAALLRVSAAIHGVGAVIAHDPQAYGTAEFDVAWANTCAAFAKRGIKLTTDYRSDVGGFRSAASCLVLVGDIQTIQLAA